MGIQPVRRPAASRRWIAAVVGSAVLFLLLVPHGWILAIAVAVGIQVIVTGASHFTSRRQERLWRATFTPLLVTVNDGRRWMVRPLPTRGLSRLEGTGSGAIAVYALQGANRAKAVYVEKTDERLSARAVELAETLLGGGRLA